MEEAAKTYAYYSKNLGRYNLCSNENDWHLSLHTSGGNFSETWPEDDEPYIDGLLPSQVMDLIEERLKSYWIATKRDETLARMAVWRERKDDFDLAWLQNKRDNLTKSLGEIETRIKNILAG